LRKLALCSSSSIIEKVDLKVSALKELVGLPSSFKNQEHA